MESQWKCFGSIMGGDDSDEVPVARKCGFNGMEDRVAKSDPARADL